MEDEPTKQATQAVEAKIGLGVHAAVYVFVNAVLIAVNLANNPDHLWFQWPLLGWGAGLGLHALLVLTGASGSAFKQRLIEKELQRRASHKS
jgi:2TM domain